ncbi:MAG TPA: prepilin peptidase [Gaiellaceae bacterium]|nr:prepilin peptidase [Gaiellaceae bacterium]
MEVAVAAFAFAPGLALGSFLNVVAARVPLRRSVVKPASACMSCGTQLAARDNVPVVSWLLLRGRCRHCAARIPFRYPAVELATAALLAVCVLVFGLTFDALLAAFFCAVLVAISAVDVEHRIVPNRIVIPATAVLLPLHTLVDPTPEWALGAFGAALFLFVAVLAYPAGMGMGDVKLALFMGAMLGKTVAVGLMVGMLSALIPSLFLFAMHGSKARKMKIPFAPFLALGSLAALFAGEALLDAYLGFFGA